MKPVAMVFPTKNRREVAAPTSAIGEAGRDHVPMKNRPEVAAPTASIDTHSALDKWVLIG